MAGSLRSSAHTTHTPRIVVVYFLVQALMGMVWWIAMSVRPAWRERFVPRNQPADALLHYVPADGMLFVGLSFALAYGLQTQARWFRPALWLHIGATYYAGLTCWTGSLMHSGGWWASALMTGPMLALPVIVLVLEQPSSTREGR